MASRIHTSCSYVFFCVQSTEKIDIRLDSEGKFAVVNSCVHEVANDQEAWNVLHEALSRRSTKTTKMNDRSSRSHCVITFRYASLQQLFIALYPDCFHAD
jgi:acyl carrier protein phosphodiesterase